MHNQVFPIFYLFYRCVAQIELAIPPEKASEEELEAQCICTEPKDQSQSLILTLKWFDTSRWGQNRKAYHPNFTFAVSKV